MVRIRRLIEKTDKLTFFNFELQPGQVSYTVCAFLPANSTFVMRGAVVAAFLPSEKARFDFVRHAQFRITDGSSQREVLNVPMATLWAVATAATERAKALLDARKTIEDHEFLDLALLWQEVQEAYDWRLPAVPGAWIMPILWEFPPAATISVELDLGAWNPVEGGGVVLSLPGIMSTEVS